MPNIQALTQGALDLLFPPRCVNCGGGGALLCGVCRASMRPPEQPICERCGQTLDAQRKPDARLCGVCAESGHPEALRFLTGLRAAMLYEGATRQAVLALKFRRQRRIASILGEILAETHTRLGLTADLIIPVPLHPKRERARGYNQSRLLAEVCAKRLRTPMRADLVVRHRETRPQVDLARHARLANVASAFTLTTPGAAQALTGKRILLIDDVTTTGATMNAVAEALQVGRPAALWGLAFSRPSEGAEHAPQERYSSAQHGRQARQGARRSQSWR